jgi:galacturan 1,4-alpha-galacturonidase
LDGNGQAWYDLYAKNIYILRPILFGLIGAKGATVEDLKFRYSPQWYTFVANSSDVVFSNIDIAGGSVSKNPAKNTDGWDTYRSDNVVIQNSNINNGDDCVSFKPNSTNIIVQNLVCNGSHGISVGSLGQYAGEVDYVENVYVYNVSMSNASDGARIKVWPGASSALSGDLQGGGGSGAVKNITYDGMVLNNVDYAIEITQCYGQKNLTLCNEVRVLHLLHPSLSSSASKMLTLMHIVSSQAHHLRHHHQELLRYHKQEVRPARRLHRLL